MQEKIQNISPIKQRVLQFIGTLHISKREFYKKTGISRGTLESNSGITEDILAKVIANFENLSPDWILTGNGPMLRNNVSQSIDGNHNIQANGDVKIDESSIKLKEKISYLENQVCFLTEQVKEKDNQINTLLSIMSNK